MSVLQKAFFCPYEDTHINFSSEHAFSVPFNPAEIVVNEAIGAQNTDKDDTRFRAKCMLNGHSLGWQRLNENSTGEETINNTSISMTLFFNTLTDVYQDTYQDVRDDIKKLYYYTNADNGINESNQNKKINMISFVWGSITMVGILTQMNVHYTMFAPNGVAVRAQAEITIKGKYIKRSSGALRGMSAPAAQTSDMSEWRNNYKGAANPRIS